MYSGKPLTEALVGVGSVITPILQMRKQKHKEVK